jgi:hypothetical protein
MHYKGSSPRPLRKRAVSSEAAKHGLPKKPDKRMMPIRARARVGQHLAGHRGQSERVVEFPVGKQSGVGGNDWLSGADGNDARPGTVGPRRL